MTSASTGEAAAAIVRLGRRVAAAGLVVGSGGNVSVRTGKDQILVTPSGHGLDELLPEELVTLGLDGSVRAGTATPTSEAHMHLAAHRARPDAPVALHLHPPHANLLAALGRTIRLITLDHAYYVRSIGSVPYIKSGTQEVADAAAEALAEHDCVMLGHHGCVVVADDIGLAAQRAQNLEEAATATYRALLLGDETTVCPPAYMEAVRAAEGA